MPVSPPETRATLILRLRNADDVAAWDEFVMVYGPVIYRAARRRGLQPADAEDVVQQVLLKVAESVTNWLERSQRGPFRAWLLTIARNEAVNLLTLRATRRLGEDGEAALQKMRALPVYGEISALIELEYERAVFRWAADCVKQDVARHTWRAFWLTHVNGLSIPEAAKKLNTRPGNIHFARSRVMARIKELVRRHEEGSG